MADFPVTPSTRVERYEMTGGETSLPVGWPVFSAGDIRVLRRRSGADVTLVLDTDYSVSGIGAAAATVTLTLPAMAGDLVAIVGAMPIQRVTDYVESGDFTARSVNGELDRMTAWSQELARQMGQSLRLPDTDAPPQPLPSAPSRAGWLLGFDAAGGPALASYPSLPTGTRLDTVAQLRVIPPPAGLTPSAVPLVQTVGAETADDGGGGWWLWSAGSTAEDNTGTVIRPATISPAQPGRWLRSWSGAAQAVWFGVRARDLSVEAGEANRLGLIRALAAAQTVDLPAGQIPLCGPVRISAKLVRGTGANSIPTEPAEYGSEIVDMGGGDYCLWAESIRVVGTREKPRHWGLQDITLRKYPGVTGETVSRRVGIKCGAANFGLFSRLTVVDYNGCADTAAWKDAADIAFDLTNFDSEEFEAVSGYLGTWTEMNIFSNISIGNSCIGFMLQSTATSGGGSYNFCVFEDVQITHMPVGSVGTKNDRPVVGFYMRRRETAPGVWQSQQDTPILYQGRLHITAYISPVDPDASVGQHFRAAVYNEGCRVQEIVGGISMTGEAVGANIPRWYQSTTADAVAPYEPSKVGGLVARYALVHPSITVATGYQYRVESIATSGISAASQPVWATDEGEYTPDGTCLWQAVSGDGVGATTWAPGTAYAEGTTVKPIGWVSGQLLHRFPAGIAAFGPTEPAWPTTIGATVTDGRITYVCVPGIWGWYNGLSDQWRCVYNNYEPFHLGGVGGGTRHFLEKLPYDALTSPYNNVRTEPENPTVPNETNIIPRSGMMNINGNFSFGIQPPSSTATLTVSAFENRVPLLLDPGGPDKVPALFFRASRQSALDSQEYLPIWISYLSRDAPISDRLVPLLRADGSTIGRMKFLGGVRFGGGGITGSDREFSCRQLPWANGEVVERGSWRFGSFPSPGAAAIWCVTTSGVVGVDAVIKAVATVAA